MLFQDIWQYNTHNFLEEVKLQGKQVRLRHIIHIFHLFQGNQAFETITLRFDKLLSEHFLQYCQNFNEKKQ